MKPCTFESNFLYHKVITTILRKTLCKGNPKTIFHRDYESFSKFHVELKLFQSPIECLRWGFLQNC